MFMAKSPCIVINTGGYFMDNVALSLPYVFFFATIFVEMEAYLCFLILLKQQWHIWKVCRKKTGKK